MQARVHRAHFAGDLRLQHIIVRDLEFRVARWKGCGGLPVFGPLADNGANCEVRGQCDAADVGAVDKQNGRRRERRTLLQNT